MTCPPALPGGYRSLHSLYNPLVTLDLSHILGPDGPIADRLGGDFEERPQQKAMIEAVGHALDTGGKLVVEAGTGVGKSFGYLLPAIEHIAKFREDKDQKRRVVISTHTIALQEQIINKDVPMLQAVLPDRMQPAEIHRRCPRLIEIS